MSETAGQQTRAFPPVVYAPTVPGDEGGQVRLEMIELVDGRRALVRGQEVSER